MPSPSLATALAVAVFPFAAAVRAQDPCPWQTTQNVPAALTHGPAQACAGVDYRIGELQLTTAKGACPLYVIYTPPHQLAVAATTRSRVQVQAQQPITKVVFQCLQDWFLFLPIGSSCAKKGELVLGTVPQLLAIPCD